MISPINNSVTILSWPLRLQTFFVALITMLCSHPVQKLIAIFNNQPKRKCHDRKSGHLSFLLWPQASNFFYNALGTFSPKIKMLSASKSHRV